MTSKPISIITEPIKNNQDTAVPRRVVSRPDKLEGGEEVEIAAQISVPQEGGWGWVVVLGAFWCLFILDGIAFTFGSILTDMTEDLKLEDSFVALLNSVALALYFTFAPLASALINRYGFRECTMSGSIIASVSLFISYFSFDYASLFIFYGLGGGFGFCLVNMAAGLVVGFYFERLRSLAISLVNTGSSGGVMLFFPLNTYLVGLAGWRSIILLHSGLLGIIFFLAMVFRPLLSVTIENTKDEPTRTVTFLPSLSKVAMPTASSGSKVGVLKPTGTERFFSAVSNANFPTAAAVVEDGTVGASFQPGTSARTTTGASKLTFTVNNPQGSVNLQQLKQLQSIVPKAQSTHEKIKNCIEHTIHVEVTPKKRKCCPHLCHWEKHVPQSRPLYRDDAFYNGRIDKLLIYQKSMTDTGGELKAGLEYQMAVSRVATPDDLQEKRGVFTTAVRRVLATMIDPKLLKRSSFCIFVVSGFLTYMGFMVPYVFIKDRNYSAGIEMVHCMWFVTVIGLTNAIGRLCLGALAVKFSPLKIYTMACCFGGISCLLSDLSYNVYYQYAYCAVYGFFIGSLTSLRSIVIVSTYGLDKLTNATGILLMFQGIGSLISTPLAGVLKNNFGYAVAFYVSGGFMVLSSLILLPIKKLAENEVHKENENKV